MGPAVRVKDETALKSDLGKSILERLCSHYKAVDTSNAHSATLLTNYRCHASILTLSSSLYYEHTLLPRSDIKAHPNAPYPLVFVATSLEENDTVCNVYQQELQEVDALVNKVLFFLKSWPNDWPPQKYPKIGVLASTRKQVKSCYVCNNHTLHYITG